MTHDTTPPKRIWASYRKRPEQLYAYPWPSHEGAAEHEYILASEVEAMVAAALREAAKIAVRHWEGEEDDSLVMCEAILTLIPQPDAAALDRAILEAKSEIAALLGITTTRDTMTKEPVMWGDADGDCLTPEIAVQCALDKLIREAEARVRDHAAQIGGDAAVEVLLRHEPDASPLKIQLTRQAIANPIRRAAKGEAK